MWPKTFSLWLFLFLLALFTSTPAISTNEAHLAQAQNDLIWGWDAAFGQGGVAAYHAGYGYADDISFQQTYGMPDGTILAGIQSWHYGKFSQQFSEVVRFSEDGSVADQLIFYDDPTMRLVGVQSDGSFILSQYSEYPYLTRYWSDFTQDTSFGSGGEARLPGEVISLSVLPDDKILGAVHGGYLFRLNPDGSMDGGFSSDFGPFAELTALVADGQGNLLIADVDYNSNRCLARVFTQDGTLLGTVYDTVPWQPENYCFPGVFVPYPQGGFVWSWGGKQIYKVNLDGSPDLSFGEDGMVQLSLPLGEVFPSFLYLAVGDEGQVYITRSLYVDDAGHPLVGGFDRYGQPEPGFGPLGYIHLNLAVDEVGAIFALPDGKLLLAGVDDPDYLLMRLAAYPLSERVYLPWVSR